MKLSTSFAGHSRWKTYSDHQPKYAGTKRTRDGRRRAKTCLEQLSSTDESEEDAEPETRAEKEEWLKCRRKAGDTEFLAVLQSIGMDGDDGGVDEATARLVAQHVQEFVRERLNPTSKIKDALAWWAAKEAT